MSEARHVRAARTVPRAARVVVKIAPKPGTSQVRVSATGNDMVETIDIETGDRADFWLPDAWMPAVEEAAKAAGAIPSVWILNQIFDAIPVPLRTGIERPKDDPG